MELPVILIAILLSTVIVNCNKTPLYFSYITTFTGDYVTSGAIPMVDRALDQINSRTDILENYTLNYTTILDSECRSTPALDSFLHHFKNKSQPTYISSLCCGCSSATIPVASISHHWNIPQVTFSAADTDLKDRKKFKSLFRALPSFDFKAEAYAQLMREFGWKQMVMIFQEEVLFSKVKTSLEAIYKVEGWDLLEIPLESRLYDLPYDHIFDQITAGNHRIIVLNCYMEYSILFLCEAYQRGMMYPDYVFMLLGKFHDEWWKYYKFDESNTKCTNKILTSMINGSLSIAPEGNYISEIIQGNTTSGEDADMFLRKYYELLDNDARYKDIPESGIVGVAYDAIWSLAIGLDIASKKISAGNDSGCGHLPGDLVPLEQFDYYNEKLGCIMTQSMEEVKFTGITREYSYVNRGPIDNVYLVNQERIKENNTVYEVLVAKLFIPNRSDMVADLSFLPNEDISTLWGSDTPPYDGSPVPRFVRSSIILEVICYFVASLGLIFVACCAIFNIIFRSKMIVKLASPNLNNIVLFGSALMYISVFFYSFSLNSPNISSYTVICNVEIFTFSIGYTSCFAVILSKQWRVYYIFNNPTAKKKTIKDHILLIIITTIIIVDLFIVLVGVAVPQIRIQAFTVKHDDEYSLTEDGVLHQNSVIVCSNKKAFVWLTVSFLYKASLQVIAIFMAFHTRKVKIKALNDSKEITAIIYINSIILTLLAVVEFGLHSSFNEVYAALFSVGIIVAASLFTGIIFIPKMVGLYFDPEGNRVFVSSSSASKKNSENRNQFQGLRRQSSSGHGPGSNNLNTVASLSEIEAQQLQQQLQFPQGSPPSVTVLNSFDIEASLSTSPEERTTVVATAP